MDKEYERYVTAWQASVEGLLALLPGLSEADWDLPTDCPGWSVHDVVAHLAALEHELATGQAPAVGSGDGQTLSGDYTQAGVDARRERTPVQLIDEFAESIAIRQRVLAHPPPDLDALPERRPGGVAWSWRVLLRNRAIDVWVHEQDIRRATRNPGGFDSPAALLTIRTFLAAMPYVFARRAGAEPGQRLLLVVDGQEFGVQVCPDGRGHPAIVAAPEVTIRMGAEAFTILAAGRRAPEDVALSLDGDGELARRFLAGMTLTF